MNSMGLGVRVLASTTVEENGTKEEEIKKDDKEDSSESEDSGSDSDTDSSSSSSQASQQSSETLVDELRDSRRRHVSAIQEAQLSPDGKVIFTTDYDRTFSAYPMYAYKPGEPSACSLTPFAAFTSPDPIWAFSVNPQFDTDDPTTTTVLVSRKNQYISMHNALYDVSNQSYQSSDGKVSNPATPVNISTKLASYKFIDHLTEAVIAPISLTYSRDGARFHAGSQNEIATFDLEYTGDPVSKILTIPSKRNKLKGGGRGFKGYISALSISPSSTLSRNGVLAAGSRTRYMALYDLDRSGEEITQFSLPGQVNGKKTIDEDSERLMGEGVSQLKWSPCGYYLYVAERSSDVVLIYDLRKYRIALSHCKGRRAVTKQRLGFDVWSAGDRSFGDSHEIWAGGVDGKIRVWKDPHCKEGALDPDCTVDIGDAPVASTLVHPCGSLAVAASGCQDFGDQEKGKERGRLRGGGHAPKFREWGSLDILGLW